MTIQTLPWLEQALAELENAAAAAWAAGASEGTILEHVRATIAFERTDRPRLVGDDD